jgi:hypothetical protein
MTEDIVLCKDCKHSFRSLVDLTSWGTGYEYRCRRNFKDKTIDINLVTGPVSKSAHYEMCSSSRIGHSDNVCGKRGLWWEPKHKKHYFIWLKRIGNI